MTIHSRFERFRIHLETTLDRGIRVTVVPGAMVGNVKWGSDGWRTYTAALEWAARICADPDGDHSEETIDRTGEDHG